VNWIKAKINNLSTEKLISTTPATTSTTEDSNESSDEASTVRTDD
jgi:hypothetical protein